jgi:CRP/FNR family transcriptional regulator
VPRPNPAQTDRSVLKRARIFAGLSDDDRAALAAVAVRRRYGGGESIFSEGDAAAGFYVVAKGQVKVYKLGPDGKEQIIRIVTPGEPFAEAAALSGGAYPAYAEARRDCELVFFDAERFRELLAANPQLAVNMIGALCGLLRGLVDMVEELALKDVSARLAKYLLDLSLRVRKGGAEGDTVELPIKKSELAARLGTVSETLSRTLAKLAGADVIAVDGSTIRLLDPDALAEIAAGLRL